MRVTRVNNVRMEDKEAMFLREGDQLLITGEHLRHNPRLRHVIQGSELPHSVTVATSPRRVAGEPSDIAIFLRVGDHDPVAITLHRESIVTCIEDRVET